MAMDWSQYPTRMPCSGTLAELDDTHPLTVGLLAYCLASKGSGDTVVNLVEAGDGDLTLQNEDQWNWTERGPQVASVDETGAPGQQLRYSSSGAVRYIPGAGNAFTAFIIVETNAMTDFDGLFMKVDTAANWDKGFGLARVNNLIRAWVDDYNTAGNYVTLAPATPGGYNAWAIRYDGATLKLTRVDFNGTAHATPQAKVATTLNLASNQYADLIVGASKGGGTQTAQTNFLLYAQWNRALSDNELSTLIDNPFVLARFPRSQALRLLLPMENNEQRPMLVWIDEDHNPDTHATVALWRGTHNSDYTEWDVLEATFGIRDQNLFGGIRWTEVAPRRKAAIYAVFAYTSGATNSAPYAMGGSSPCNEMWDERAALAAAAYFAGLPNSEVCTTRERCWASGWSSGLGLAVDFAIRQPQLYSKVAGRHGAIALTTDPQDTLDQLNYSLNTLANNNWEWGTPPELPMPNPDVPSGCSNTGSNGGTFDWRTSADSKTVEIAILNGSHDPAENTEGDRYADWIAETFLVMRTFGYSEDLLWQVIVEGGEEDPQVCPFPSDPMLQTRWSDYCHAQSIGWAEKALWIGRSAFDEDSGAALYCTRADIEARYGRANVASWADLNNGAGGSSDDDVEGRVDTAIEDASREIDEILRGSRYAVPFETAPNSPSTIKRIAVMLAGFALYNARGATDFDEEGGPVHRLSADRKEALKKLDQLAAGIIRMAVDQVATAIPAAVEITTPVNAAGQPPSLLSTDEANWNEE